MKAVELPPMISNPKHWNQPEATLQTDILALENHRRKDGRPSETSFEKKLDQTILWNSPLASSRLLESLAAGIGREFPTEHLRSSMSSFIFLPIYAQGQVENVYPKMQKLPVLLASISLTVSSGGNTWQKRSWNDTHSFFHFLRT